MSFVEEGSLMSFQNSRFDNVCEPPLHDRFETYKKYNNDYNPDKVNLRNVTYKDDDGKPWYLPIIERIKMCITTDDSLRNRYLPTLGMPSFNEATAKFLLGKTSPAILENKIINIQTVSEVTSIILAATFMLKYLRLQTIYMSTPCNDRIKMIFQYIGFKDIRHYTYWSNEMRRVDFEGMKNDLEFAPKNSIVSLYVIAHNPTSYDLTEEQWDELSDIIKSHDLYPFFYSDNLGIVSGNIDKDAYSIRLFVKKNIEFMCVQDFEINFCLYNERVSSLMLYTLDSRTLKNIEYCISSIAEALYNSPNTHGARVIANVLNCEQFYLIWLDNVKTMAKHIKKLREMLRSALEMINTPGDWSILTAQHGIWAYIPLNENQVNHMMDHYHLYLQNTGRISITNINKNNLNYVVKAFQQTLLNVE